MRLKYLIGLMVLVLALLTACNTNSQTEDEDSTEVTTEESGEETTTSENDTEETSTDNAEEDSDTSTESSEDESETKESDSSEETQETENTDSSESSNTSETTDEGDGSSETESTDETKTGTDENNTETEVETEDEVAIFESSIDLLTYTEYTLFDAPVKVMVPDIFSIIDERDRIAFMETVLIDSNCMMEMMYTHDVNEYADDKRTEMTATLTDVLIQIDESTGDNSWHWQILAKSDGVDIAIDARFVELDGVGYMVMAYINSPHEVPFLNAYSMVIEYMTNSLVRVDNRVQASADEVAEFSARVDTYNYVDHYFFETTVKVPLPEGSHISEYENVISVMTGQPDTQISIYKHVLNDMELGQTFTEYAEDHRERFGDRITDIVISEEGMIDDEFFRSTYTCKIDGIETAVDSYFIYGHMGNVYTIEVMTMAYYELPHFDTFKRILENMRAGMELL